MLSAGLMLSQAVVSFADAQGVMEPEDYVFFVIFRSCGISPGLRYIGPWMEAYKGYLESTHNNVLLSQVNSYSNLSWGDTVNGIDVVFESVKNWLSLSDSYGVNGNYYTLPSSNLPLEPDSSMESYEARVSSRIADVSCDVSDYEYLFSSVDVYKTGDYELVNYYAPKGQEILGVYSSASDYCDSGSVTFYTRSGSGYSTAWLKTNSCTYDSSWILKSSYPALDSVYRVDGFGIRSMSNFPLKVFYSTYDMSNYCKTDNVVNTFSSGSLRLSPSIKFFDLGLQKIDDYEVGGALALPSDSSDALNCWNNLSGATSAEALLSAINASGMDITYRPSYKLEHYVQKYSADGTYIWEKNSESSHTGVLNEPALIEPLEISGFTYAPELVPEEKTVLLDGSLVVPVYYTCDPVSYIVEHYTKNIVPDGKEDTWTLVNTETFTGIPGTQAVYSAKDYPNYLIDYNLTEPSDCQIPSDGSLVIRLYYKPDPDAVYPYTVEYYKDGECFETVSGTVPMFGDRMVRDYEDFCPKYYLFDRKASTPLPFEVSEENSTIRISYKRDVYATFSYTAEYYKDGELFKSLPGTVSVFNPYVKTCISYCPKGYVLDTTSSTALPFEVPETGGVVKNYYVKQETVFPYTVEYYKDGLHMSAFSGNVPSASPLLQSFPSRCPEYYTLDQERSTPMPYTVPEGGGRIKVYYKKDEGATFPYTVECYKDGEFVESVSKTVSVFDPAVKEYGFDCPEGYVVDTSSSTYLPYSVSKDSNVIRYYYVDEGKSLPYTVEYYKDGKEFSTLSGNVPVTSPVVNSYWPYCPEGYIRDGASSDSLPFTVTTDHNVIKAYYIPDPSNPYTSFTGGVTRLVNFVIDFFGKAIFWLFILVVFYLFIDKNLVLVKRITSRAKSRDSNQKKKKKLFTAPKSRFMKGVHANRGTSLKSKAKMKHREKIYVRPDLRRPRGSHKQNGLGM